MTLPDRMPELVIIDLDETLIDHRPVLRQAFTRLFRNASIAEREKAQRNLDLSMRRFHNAVIVWDDFSRTLAEPMSSNSYAELKDAYNNAGQYPFYDGAIDFLKALKKRGISLYLVTKAEAAFTERILKSHGVAGLFSRIYTRSEETKTAQYSRAFNHFAALSPVAWIIGDSCDDLQCAIELGRPDVYPVAFSEKSAASLLPPRLPKDSPRYCIPSYGEALKRLGLS